MERTAPIWEDNNWQPLPQLEGAINADVCVVGLGASGLAALEALQTQGINAIGVDAGMVGAGAAGHNGGFVMTGISKFFHETVNRFGSSIANDLHKETRDEIARQADMMPRVVRKTGALRIAGTEDEVSDCRAQFDALRAGHFKAHWYDGQQGKGVFLPDDGSVQPLGRARTLARHFLIGGGRLLENSTVKSIEPGKVITSLGSISCQRVIVAVDGHLERVLPELNGRVRTARLQMLGTAPAPEVTYRYPVYYRRGYEYWQQLPDGRIALGGFRDHNKKAEWTHSNKPTPKIQGLLTEFLRDHLQVQADVTHRWASNVAYTKDNLPILEEVREGVWATGAYNGLGNVVGMLCGRAAACLATGRRSTWADVLNQAKQAASK